MPEIKRLFVSWTLEIEAETPEQAARLALAIIQEPDTLATRFVVTDPETEEETLVDIGAPFGTA